MTILQSAIKVLKAEDAIHLYNLMIDNVESNVTVSSTILMSFIVIVILFVCDSNYTFKFI